MYDYHLIISIFSHDHRLETIVQGINPEQQFSHEVATYEQPDQNIIQNSDILIWDLPVEKLLEYKDQLKNYGKIIICVDEYKKEFSMFDGILLKPYQDDYAKFIIKELLYKIKLEEDLRDVNNRFDIAIDSIPDMYWEKDLKGIHRKVNKVFCETVGKPREDIEGKDHYYIWNVSRDDPNSGADICAQTEKMVIAKGSTHSFSETIKSHNENRQLKTYKSPIYDRNNKAIGTSGIGQDITNFKNKTIENEKLLNCMPTAVLIKDNKGNIININKYFLQCFGLTKSEVEGVKYEQWAATTFQPGRTTNTEGYTEGVTYPIDGIEKQFELRSNDITDTFGNKTGEICTFREVTKERKLEKENIEKSYTDQLTKLYNRQFLEQFISEQPDYIMLSLIAIDLDNFKKVNDTYGHQSGDNALKLAAATLKKCFPNDVVIRMGGDEFLVIKAGNYSIEEVEDETNQFLEMLNTNFTDIKEFSNLPAEEGSTVSLSASAGITQGFLALDSFDIIYKYSDTALYEAKKKGKNCCYIYENKTSNLMKKYMP